MLVKEKHKGIIGAGLVFTGAICFSAKAIMVKIAYMYKIDTVSLLTLRMVFALPFFIIIPILYGKKFTPSEISFKEWLSLIFLGLVGYYLASLFDFLGLLYISAGLERLILFVYPTIVVILSAIVYKTKIGKTGYIALALTYIGIYIVFANDLSLRQKNGLLGSALIFASAFTYAIYLIGSGRLIPKYGAMQYTSYAMIFSTIAVIAHYLILHDVDLFHFSKEVYFLGLTMAIFSTVIPSFLLSEGINMIGSSKASIVASIGPVSTIVLAYIFLGESFSMAQFIGTVIVMSGVLIVSLSSKK